ncbi:Arm DNA-binding domain-containing protein, partial [Altererythrobacter sp.]|uniref:Arm DNA-binding domain-containing protein n=1 Tax=Altererythrobacter sp. TaxID=1872480 RepID=UPI003D052912
MLTDKQCKAAQPKAKPYKLGDQHGLYLLVSPTGNKSWKLKYRFDGKEKKLSFGSYPEVKLSEARDRMFDARALLRRGLDPARPSPRDKEEQVTFARAAEKWLSLQEEGWKPKHARTVRD